MIFTYKLQILDRFNGVRWQLALGIPLGGAGATPVDQQQRLIMIKIKTMMMIMMMMMIMLMIVIIMIIMIMRRSSPCRSIAETDNDYKDDKTVIIIISMIIINYDAQEQPPQINTRD